MDFFHFIFVLPRAKVCQKFCIYQKSNAEILQSVCTAYSISKRKHSQIAKRSVNIPSLKVCPL